MNNHLDFLKYRKDFPLLKTKMRGKNLVYLDTGATSQKPQIVIDAVQNYYLNENANIHRGVYHLSEASTEKYENVRKAVKDFIQAQDIHEIIFVKGTTEAINLVAHTYGQENFSQDDEIILSVMEHHSNIVPWQILAEQKKIKLKIIPMFDNGELDIDAYKKLFTSRTKFVAITHASNALGTINPIKEMIELAHQYEVPVLVDGAQAAPHFPVNVSELDCDFYTFSSHKMYGPTGCGVLYGKKHLLEAMPPYQGGGDMISSVSFEKTTYNKIPYKFEAGTPAIASVVGFGKALEYLQNVGMHQIEQHEQELLQYATNRLTEISDLKILGTAKAKVGVLSFVLENIHPHDIGTILDNDGIAIRAGHHCAMPLMQRLNVPATVRASLGLYNNTADVDALISGLQRVKKIFA